jgi:hypothetical protein
MDYWQMPDPRLVANPAECEAAWRKRLAFNLRHFRRSMGRWPDMATLDAAKRGIDDAVRHGIMPETWH